MGATHAKMDAIVSAFDDRMKNIDAMERKISDARTAFDAANGHIKELRGAFDDKMKNVDAIERKISDAGAVFDVANERIKDLHEKFLTSRKKGLHSEIEIANLLEEYYAPLGHEIQRVGSEKDKCGDIHMYAEGAHVLIVEVKNYEKSVPQKEVEKFWRDMKRYGGVCGLMVSVYSPISHQTNGTVKSIGTSPLMYLSRTGYAPEQILQGVNTLLSIRKVWNPDYDKNVKHMETLKAEQEQVHAVLQRAKEQCDLLSRTLKKRSLFRKSHEIFNEYNL